MMKTKTILSMITLAASAMLFGGEAKAESIDGPLVNCIDGDEDTPPLSTNKRQYQAGLRYGKTFVRRIWDRLPGEEKDPDRIQEVLGDITSRVTGRIVAATDPDDLTDRSLCRLRGAFLGTSEEIASILQEVIDVCADEGYSWGVVTAQMYCDLAIDYPPEVVEFCTPPAYLCKPICEGTWGAACYDGFADEAEAYLNEDGASCLPYTQGDYRGAFRKEQKFACDYAAHGPTAGS